jgi:hypothetical protein
MPPPDNNRLAAGLGGVRIRLVFRSSVLPIFRSSDLPVGMMSCAERDESDCDNFSPDAQN